MSDAGAGDPAHDCWGCGREPSVEGTLGEACRHLLATRTTDPATPRVNEMVARLRGDVYARLCWNCEAALSEAISGLCPLCESELRR